MVIKLIRQHPYPLILIILSFWVNTSTVATQTLDLGVLGSLNQRVCVTWYTSLQSIVLVLPWLQPDHMFWGLPSGFPICHHPPPVCVRMYACAPVQCALITDFSPPYNMKTNIRRRDVESLSS